jgi:hypothetical protein
LRRRRILGLKKEVVTGGWRQLHTEEISYRYSLPDINSYKDKIKEDNTG